MNFDRVATHDGSTLLEHARELIDKAILKPGEFVIAGSARLWVEGIISTLTDLDIVVNEEAWKRVWEIAVDQPGCSQDDRLGARFGIGTVDSATIVRFFNGRIEVSDHWVAPHCDTEFLIEHAEYLGDLPYISLAEIIRYKRHLNRPKDLQALEAIRNHRRHIGAAHTARQEGPEGV